MHAKNKIIERSRAVECLRELEKIGWFSNSVIESIVLEVEHIG